MKLHEKGVENIAQAVIMQAVADYRRAFWGNRVAYKDAESTLRELEKYFHSQEYESLTSVSGDYLIKNIKIDEYERWIGLFQSLLEKGSSTTLFISVVETDKNGKKKRKSVKIPPRILADMRFWIEAQVFTFNEYIKELKGEN
jgi:hypothetical protein